MRQWIGDEICRTALYYRASQARAKVSNIGIRCGAVFSPQASLVQGARPKSFNHSGLAIWDSHRKMSDVAEVISVYSTRPLPVSINRQLAIDIQGRDVRPEVDQPRKTESHKLMK